MSREIKFRAWDKDNKKMAYPTDSNYLFSFDDDGMYCCRLEESQDFEGESYTKEIRIDNKMQYTGITDKNGKEIYDGDIFKFKDEAWSSCYTSCGTEYDSWEVENFGVVGFDEENARYDFVKYKFNENSIEADLHENHSIEFADFLQEHEVIGNIWENPELLKESETGESN